MRARLAAVVLAIAAASAPGARAAAAQAVGPPLPAAAPPPAAPAGRETAAAREQARLCEREHMEKGAAACRAALALGIGPERRGPLREKLARHLVALENWDGLAELFRDGVRLEPQSALAWYRLGSTLLFALEQPAEALPALEQAARLDPSDPASRVARGVTLHALGRYPDAVAAFDEALRLDPATFEGRPAARAVYEAARRGERWP